MPNFLNFLSCRLFFLNLLLLASVSLQANELQGEWVNEAKKYSLFQEIEALPQIAFRLGGSQNILSWQPEKLMIPASITKLLTGHLALKHWGAAFRFKTDVLIKQKEQVEMEIVGYGDPMLTSEVMDQYAQQIASTLKKKGMTHVDRLVLNQSYFSQTRFSGIGKSSNPYDALPSALTANFNTINVRFDQAKWLSAEDETPLTQAAKSMAEQWFTKIKPKYSQRVTFHHSSGLAEQHLAELWQIFLKNYGISVATVLVQKDFVSPRFDGQQTRLQLQSPYRLEEVIMMMMKYSTNFIAHQLLLALTAESQLKPASAANAQKWLQEQVVGLGWQGAVFEEGAGLSYQNRVSALQIIDLLHKDAALQALLPQRFEGVWAKTGTLTGIRTLAGYIDVQGEKVPFVIFIDSPSLLSYRKKLVLAFQALLSTKN